MAKLGPACCLALCWETTVGDEVSPSSITTALAERVLTNYIIPAGPQPSCGQNGTTHF